MSEITSEKAKLTLGIDKEVIRKAKSAGINISSITEQLLKAMTFEPREDTVYDDIISSYEIFFDAIGGILRKYNLGTLAIGEVLTWEDQYTDKLSVNLGRDGSLYLWDDKDGSASKVLVSQVLNDFYPASQILNTLVKELVRVTENNKRKLQELKFALKFLKTLSDEENGNK